MKIIPLLLITLTMILPLKVANAFEEINTGYLSNLAVDGYDSTAYFQQTPPQLGDKEYSFKWNGATWRFVNKESLDLFSANPDRYRPQYGGYCSNQMSMGNLSDIDPHIYLIYQERLYLFGHDVGRGRWVETGIENRIKDADANWQKYLASRKTN